MGLIPSKKFLALIIVGLIAAMSVTGAFVYQVTRDLPDIGDVKSIIKNQTSYIYASDGTLLTRLFSENRTIVPIEQISPTLQEAVIAVEDQRFYAHKGVDYIRIVGALVKDLRDLETAQGGSTITQQYVKNAYFSHEKTLTRKIKEAFLASELERNYSKQQILEKYLNTIYFGDGNYGIEAASQSYFGVPAKKLNLAQSALLAGLIKGPELYNPYKYPVEAEKRRNLVLDLMVKQDSITDSQAKAAKSSSLLIRPKKHGYQGLNPYFTEWVKTELEKLGVDKVAILSQGLRIHTTLDIRMQESAELAWKKYLPKPSDPEIAIVAVEPSSGAVQAMVGGKNFSEQKYNLATQGARQPGSAFKPFALAAGLMSGISPDDGYDASSPKTFKVTGSKPWIVHNYSGESGAGYMDLRSATTKSVNVVYAGLITEIGADKVVNVAKKLGITKSYLNPDPAIALGGLKVGVSPLEMASAYATFANNGVYNEPYGVQRIELANGKVIYEHKANPKEAVDRAVSYLVTECLQDVIKHGTGLRARIGRPAAGKTGTTQKYVDAWFCGYTPDLAAAVWVGHKDKQIPMTNVHGIRVAGGTFPAQIWATFMKRALKDVKPRNFDRAPKGSLVYVSLCDESNLVATDFCPETSSHVFVRKYKPKDFKNCDVHTSLVIPNLVGLSKEDAIKVLTELKLTKLTYKVTEKQSDKPTGQVIEQTPAGGTEIKEMVEIEIIVSNPNPKQVQENNKTQDQGQTITVPDVVGLLAEEAIGMLEDKGFVVDGEYRLSDMPEGRVIGQRPPAGFISQPGSSVTLVISGESGDVIVPGVIGKSESMANGILESRGFEVVIYSDTDEQNIQTYGLGAVSRQNPEPRMRTKQGSKVEIYVTAGD